MAEGEPLSLGPYHIEYNEEADRYEDDAESEQGALVQMQVLHNFDEKLGVV